jgi:hypothetical protein
MRLKREFRAMPLHDEKSGKVVGYTCMVCVYELGYAGRQNWPIWPTEAEVEMHIARDHGEKIQ